MKHLNVVLAFLVSMVVIGCGAGHANLTSITVSPNRQPQRAALKVRLVTRDGKFRQRQE